MRRPQIDDRQQQNPAYSPPAPPARAGVCVTTPRWTRRPARRHGVLLWLLLLLVPVAAGPALGPAAPGGRDPAARAGRQPAPGGGATRARAGAGGRGRSPAVVRLVVAGDHPRPSAPPVRPQRAAREVRPVCAGARRERP